MDEPLLNVVKVVIQLLASRDYEGVERLTNGRRLTAQEIAASVNAYGRTLRDLPPQATSQIQVVPVASALQPTWHLAVPLWTEEEGRSDLSLEMTVVQTSDGLRAEIDGIHVL